MWTSHGHQIIGTIAEDPIDRPRVARCGGPGLCGMCSAEAAIATRPIDKPLEQDQDILFMVRENLRIPLNCDHPAPCKTHEPVIDSVISALQKADIIFIEKARRHG